MAIFGCYIFIQSNVLRQLLFGPLVPRIFRFLIFFLAGFQMSIFIYLYFNKQISKTPKERKLITCTSLIFIVNYSLINLSLFKVYHLYTLLITTLSLTGVIFSISIFSLKPPYDIMATIAILTILIILSI